MILRLASDILAVKCMFALFESEETKTQFAVSRNIWYTYLNEHQLLLLSKKISSENNFQHNLYKSMFLKV